MRVNACDGWHLQLVDVIRSVDVILLAVMIREKSVRKNAQLKDVKFNSIYSLVICETGLLLNMKKATQEETRKNREIIENSIGTTIEIKTLIVNESRQFDSAPDDDCDCFLEKNAANICVYIY